MEENHSSLEEYSDYFKVSKSTIFSDMESIKSEMLQLNVNLYYNKGYFLKGDEWNIRDEYLRLLSIKPFDPSLISECVIRLNTFYDLKLSDYSLFYLSELLKFIKLRKNNIINKKLNLNEKIKALGDFIDLDNQDEIDYISAYILSLSTMTNRENPELIQHFAKELLNEIKHQLALNIDWNDSFVSSFENHLMASFYRIKFGFPAINDELKHIKVKYFDLFIHVKRVIESLKKPNIFYKMRDEEIGFVTAYIGGYLYNYDDAIDVKKKIILVCPQGRVVSLNLKNQIEDKFDDVDIVGTYSINELGNIIEEYDYIVSTMRLSHYKNVIEVNPILSKYDLDKLSRYLGNFSNEDLVLIEKLLTVIEENAKVKNRDKLGHSIASVLKSKNNLERSQPLLKEIITKQRIQVVDRVNDWQEAIRLSSKPLLEEEIFGEDYIMAMINAVEKFGPYIVLTDEFALPHASNQDNVKEIAMSVLVLKESIDMKGKPVKILMTLATIDNESHLKALASLVDIVSIDENLELIKKGTVDEIYTLLKGGEL